MDPKFKAYKDQDGQLHYIHPHLVEKHLQGFKPNESLVVTIKKLAAKRERSIDQNNYYWGVVVQIISEYTGYTKDETHEALKQKFLTVDPSGCLPYTLSTTDLTTDQFNDYWRAIQAWASVPPPEGFGLNIPDPNEVDYSERDLIKR